MGPAPIKEMYTSSYGLLASLILDKVTDLLETFCAEQSSYVMNKTGKNFDQN